MKRLAIVLVLVAMSGFVYAGGSDANGIRVTLVSPHAGDVLTAGQQVEVVWQVTVSGKSAGFQEQEVLLSVDGGRTFIHYPISGSLDASARSFTWTVSNRPTDHAVLDIRYGNLYGPELE